MDIDGTLYVAGKFFRAFCSTCWKAGNHIAGLRWNWSATWLCERFQRRSGRMR